MYVCHHVHFVPIINKNTKQEYVKFCSDKETWNIFDIFRLFSLYKKHSSKYTCVYVCEPKHSLSQACKKLINNLKRKMYIYTF